MADLTVVIDNDGGWAQSTNPQLSFFGGINVVLDPAAYRRTGQVSMAI
jgi:hypothetical protein